MTCFIDLGDFGDWRRLGKPTTKNQKEKEKQLVRFRPGKLVHGAVYQVSELQETTIEISEHGLP